MKKFIEICSNRDVISIKLNQSRFLITIWFNDVLNSFVSICTLHMFYFVRDVCHGYKHFVIIIKIFTVDEHWSRFITMRNESLGMGSWVLSKWVFLTFEVEKLGFLNPCSLAPQTSGKNHLLSLLCHFKVHF